MAYGLLSAVSFAAYAAFAHGLRTPAFVALGVATGVGALLSLPVLGLHGEKVLALGPAQWGAVAYLVTLGTVVPFGLFLLGVRTLPARTAPERGPLRLALGRGALEARSPSWRRYDPLGRVAQPEVIWRRGFSFSSP